MKRNFVRTLFAMLICVSLLLCMIACGDNENKGNETGTPTGEQQSTQAPNGDQSGNNNGQKPENVTAGFSKNY